MASKQPVRVLTTAAHVDFEPTSVTIAIGSGDKTKTFSADKSLLSNSSESFSRALKKEWKEGEENLVTLPEDDPEIFALYLQAVYHAIIPTMRTQNAQEEDSCCQVAREEYEKLCDLYVLVEKLQDNNVKNLVIVALSEALRTVRLDGSRYVPDAKAVASAYDGTPEGSPLRAFLRDCWVYEAAWDYTSEPHLFPQSFLYDVAVAMAELRTLPATSPPQNPDNYIGTAVEKE
ncbi:hypothetical protein BDV96DRAFT_682101 [Lophiotrema nucula]|uniref:BTB domain-containing protein n=1 Tax=Lophiotrema nucula TaxID=690887 RepID=A0A6A5ZUT5_9PLEO|nr:hypothetical protein BDV96DRAFT_682101 [Lophiotrema nucula]